MHVDAVIARAEAAVGQGIRYELGKGGYAPGHPLPTKSGTCDCSGFVAWCLGFDRRMTEMFYVQYNGGWFETTAIYKDIGESVGIFDELKTPRRGAVIVRPDTIANGQRREGHIGLLTASDKVIHCSKGNDTQTGDAIRETDLATFGAITKCRFGWLVGLRE
jgi:hypothetical protein